MKKLQELTEDELNMVTGGDAPTFPGIDIINPYIIEELELCNVTGNDDIIAERCDRCGSMRYWNVKSNPKYLIVENIYDLGRNILIILFNIPTSGVF